MTALMKWKTTQCRKSSNSSSGVKSITSDRTASPLLSSPKIQTHLRHHFLLPLPLKQLKHHRPCVSTRKKPCRHFLQSLQPPNSRSPAHRPVKEAHFQTRYQRLAPQLTTWPAHHPKVSHPPNHLSPPQLPSNHPPSLHLPRRLLHRLHPPPSHLLHRQA